METLIITILALLVAVILLGFKIFLFKDGRFPNTHIHENPEMQKRGISCARDSEFYEQK